MKKIIFLICALGISCIAEQSASAKPNIVSAGISESHWVGSGGDFHPYETIESLSKENLCATIKNIEKETHNFYINGHWQHPFVHGKPDPKPLLEVKSKSVRLKPNQKGKLCIDFPANLSGDIELFAVIDYE